MPRSSSWNEERLFVEGLAQGLELRASKVLDETAENVRRSAKNRVPVRTGRLKSSIRTQQPEPLKRVVLADTHHNPSDSYAIFVEKGTSKMPPRPFLGSSVDDSQDSFFKKVGDLLGG